MTITENAQTSSRDDERGGCPAWCTTDHTSARATWDREESGTWVHEATLADTEAFKLNLVAFQGDGDGIVELGLPDGSLTATQAREVAAALLAAADALEGRPGAA